MFKMNFMDKLPTVISCCFCCFLRAGTVLIAICSFIAGLIFAPNVSTFSGYWDMNDVLSNYSSSTETTIQLILGIVSTMLCVVSILLVIGSLCNIPKLIEIYQWGALVYSATIFMLFFVLAICCFFVYGNCYLAGTTLCVLMFLNVVFTAYFIIVSNSLRMSLKFLTEEYIPESV